MTHGRKLNIALLQMRSGTDPAANVAAIMQGVSEAARRGAELVATPEMCTLMDIRPDSAAGKAHGKVDDPGVAALRALAAEFKVHLLLGSVPVALEEGRLANRSLLIGPDGGIIARYDKIHMFDVVLCKRRLRATSSGG